MKVVATGQGLALFAEGTMQIEQIEPDLTLDGAARMLAERQHRAGDAEGADPADRERVNGALGRHISWSRVPARRLLSEPDRPTLAVR